MMLVYMFYLKKGCKKMQKILKKRKKCMTNDKIYAILIIVYCSLCNGVWVIVLKGSIMAFFCCFPFQYTGSRINN